MLLVGDVLEVQPISEMFAVEDMSKVNASLDSYVNYFRDVPDRGCSQSESPKSCINYFGMFSVGDVLKVSVPLESYVYYFGDVFDRRCS